MTKKSIFASELINIYSNGRTKRDNYKKTQEEVNSKNIYMDLNSLQNKKIAIFGLGVENYFLVKYLLKKKIECDILICDFRTGEQLGERYIDLSRVENISWNLSRLNDKNLEPVDFVFRSPGWPLSDFNIENARKNGAEITSPMQMFFDLCPSRNIIAVTGTKGKGTTASLIFKIISNAGYDVYLGGNIGVAPFSFMEKIKKDDYVVLELSSFQLEGLRINPRLAVFTNFSREHLRPADPNNPNFHKSAADYFSAKLNVFRNQSKNNVALINQNLKTKIEDCFKNTFECEGRRIYFGKADLDSRLIGEHNKENVGAAFEAAKILKINKKTAVAAIAEFKGLPHRIEFVAKKNGIEYYNDSFSTIPDSTITALKSFERPIILLAGGADKGNDFKGLAGEIKKRVKFLILFEGEGTLRLKSSLSRISFDGNKLEIVNSMERALALVSQQAEAGDVVLLSPGCASFGVFRDYKERGNLFKEGAVN